MNKQNGIQWDEFSIEACAIHKSLVNNQKQLITRGILTEEVMLLPDSYILDITKMLKVIYSKNLKGFLLNSTGVSLSDALATIDNKIFLSTEFSKKGDKRRSYTLPEISYFIYKMDIYNNEVKEYLPPQTSIEDLIDLDDIKAINKSVGSVVETGFRTTDGKSIWIEKTRLTKPQLIIMSYKPPKKTATQKEHNKKLYNFLAIVMQNAMLDYIANTNNSMSQELYEVNSDDTDDNSNSFDNLITDIDNTMEMVEEFELQTDIDNLANKALELQDKTSKVIYNKSLIKLVLQLSLHSFQPKEVARILEVKYTIISDIRELLKEALFTLTMSNHLRSLSDIKDIDSYLNNMTDNMLDYRSGFKTKKEVDNCSMVTLQKQVQKVLGSDYFLIQEVREFIDSQA